MHCPELLVMSKCQVARIDPGAYRGIVDAVAAGTRGKGTVDILDCKVQDSVKTLD